MPTVDPIESALDSIVAYFTDVLPDVLDAAEIDTEVTVRKGWPESGDDQDISVSSALLTVSAIGQGEEEACSPTSVDADGSTVTFRVGYLTVRAQLDLWCAYKAHREDLGPIIQALLNTELPKTSGLWLDSTNYYDRPLSIEVQQGRVMDDQQDPKGLGEWRRSWDLTISTDLVVTKDLPSQTSIEIVSTVDDVEETITLESE